MVDRARKSLIYIIMQNFFLGISQNLIWKTFCSTPYSTKNHNSFKIITTWMNKSQSRDMIITLTTLCWTTAEVGHSRGQLRCASSDTDWFHAASRFYWVIQELLQEFAMFFSTSQEKKGKERRNLTCRVKHHTHIGKAGRNESIVVVASKKRSEKVCIAR